MDEADRAVLGKDEIRPSCQSSVMQSVAESARMECLAQRQLRPGILVSDASHHSRPCRLVNYVGHVGLICSFRSHSREHAGRKAGDMEKPVAVVDLFSGPGGLAEGFAGSRGPLGNERYRIMVSIEKDPAAHRTLLLRSFLRKFGTEFPPEYYEFLNGEQPDEPDWHSLYRDQWQEASEEAQCLELGKPETTGFLERQIRDIRAEHGSRTVLIGGPPCQAYSLAGRARNAGITGYVPHEDERHFLYQEYVNVLGDLEPAAFVMENVKGMLSSAVKGDSIFFRIMSDLRSAAGPDSYRLFALSPTSPGGLPALAPQPRDFVVYSEEHGVPQARHRVIIVGVRRDLADRLEPNIPSALHKRLPLVSVSDVIGGMPRQRSRLSRADSQAAWHESVRHAARHFRAPLFGVTENQQRAFREVIEFVIRKNGNDALTAAPANGGTELPSSCPAGLREWIYDRRLRRLPNNDTRSHMPADLARYLFAASFARACGRSPRAGEFPVALEPNHRSWQTGAYADRFRVQLASHPATTVTCHISKDGHYYIHPDPSQCRSLTVREAARLQTFPDNYFFTGNRTQQYVQVGNAVPPFLAKQIADKLWAVFQVLGLEPTSPDAREFPMVGAINK